MKTIEHYIDVDLDLSWFAIRTLAVMAVVKKTTINKLVAEILASRIKAG